ncbi:MAG: methylmalonyl-CoA mutase, N-terminal domain [Chloroflexia bacterium]|jgi:methylmalonyl-CoA mutase N-terminal domain/subunit|nr:methylmalonyl-CoA mutase, N-terminal domain [Chloroflexia bacterium]
MVDTISRPSGKASNSTNGSGNGKENGRARYRNGAGRKQRTGQLSPEQQRIADERQRWEQNTVANSLTKLPERTDAAHFTTISGEPIDRIYTPADLGEFDYVQELGFPGEYPYTRGIHPTMYRSRYWTMRMFAGFGSVEETNERFRYLLEHGQTGLSTAFDFPTLYGIDADDPLSYGEFGKVGVGVSSRLDMELLFKDIPIDQVTVSMTINGPAAVVWAFYIAAAESRGIPRSALGGTTQNDILKEYIAQNTFIYPPEPSMRLVVDTIEFAAKEMPKWNPVSISGYHIREAGSTAAQELAFTLADGLSYVQWCVDRGLDVDDFARRLSFFFNSHNDFFEEIAKFRAARRIWARELKERFGAKDPRALWLRFHTQTSGASLTAQQPEVNIVRVALQALAGVLGGTQSLHTNSMDEALALPSDKAVRIALRTQQVIAEESGVTNTVDPLGGSYFVEALTNEMERQCYDYFDRIEEYGGVIPAIKANFFQNEIARASYEYQTEVDARRKTVVGVNKYVVNEDLEIPILEMDPQGEEKQRERLARLRADRDPQRWQEALDNVRRVALTDQNIMPALIEAAHADATLGEITDVLKSVFGVQEFSTVV